MEKMEKMNITTIFAMALMLTAPLSERKYHHTEVLFDRWNCADYTASAVRTFMDVDIEAYPYCGWKENHQWHSYIGVHENNTVIYFSAETNEEIQPHRFNRICAVRGITGYN